MNDGPRNRCRRCPADPLVAGVVSVSDLLIEGGCRLRSIVPGLVGSVFLVPGLLLSLAAPLQARILHVPADSSTIQGGILGAGEGDTVMVAPGTYFERDIDLLGRGITVTGTDPGDPDVVAATVVDGQFQGGSVFQIHSGEDSTSVLTGLTITHGNSSGVWIGNFSSPVIDLNIVRDNFGTNGGGISCAYSAPTISRNLITDNWVSEGGGGIYVWDASPVIRNNVISRNWTGTFYEAGGGIMVVTIDNDHVVIANNLIVENRASNVGGGVYLTDMVLGGEGGAGSTGGNCGRDGGASGDAPTEYLILNNVFSGNVAGAGAGLFHYFAPGMTVRNCILWGNVPDGIGSGLSCAPFAITYNDVQGGWAGAGNIDADPRFVSTLGYDYLLRPDSPCIDAGDPSMTDGRGWPEWYGNGHRADMGAYGGPGNAGWLP